MVGIIQRIREVEPSLTKSELLIANAIQKNPDIVVSKSIVDLAAFAGSSTASVSRLCRKLKLASFAALRMEIAKYLGMHSLEKNSDRNIEKSECSIIESTITSLNELKGLLFKDSIDKCTELIYSANQILLSGQGASRLGAEDLKYKLSRLGIRCTLESDEDLEKVIVSSFSKKDLCVLFSYSGMTEKVVALGQLAKKQGAKVIALTKAGKNPLSALADIVLQVPSCENSFRESATKSRILQLMLVDVLFYSLVENKKDAYAFLLSTWDVINQGKIK